MRRPLGSLLDTALGRIAQVPVLAGAVLAAIFARDVHALERRGIAEGPVHIRIRHGDGVGDGVQDAFIPVAPLPAAVHQRADGFAHGTGVFTGSGIGVLAGNDLFGIAHDAVGIADPGHDQEDQARSHDAYDKGDRHAPGKEKGHRIAQDEYNGDGKGKDGCLSGSVHGGSSCCCIVARGFRRRWKWINA